MKDCFANKFFCRASFSTSKNLFLMNLRNQYCKEKVGTANLTIGYTVIVRLWNVFCTFL